MNVLLDTHILLWWLADDPRLSGQARETLADPSRTIHVSVMRLWEIEIKLGKGKIRVDLGELMLGIDRNGFIVVSVDTPHVLAAARLPPYHGHPFDRMLIAQAITEPLRLLTQDSQLSRYTELVVRV